MGSIFFIAIERKKRQEARSESQEPRAKKRETRED
jgi:hypothetical protein